jgi:N-acetylglucosaminyldiphosphoundecaprenol N-acetyl-beta-D-mannosaminyltransferase
LPGSTDVGDPARPIPRVDVLGVGVSSVTLAGATSEIGRWIDTGARRYVCVTGVHGVMESQRDAELLRIHNGSGLTTADGMPLVWAGRFAGVASSERVYGPDLMLDVCLAGLVPGWRHYFYGGGQGVAELLSARLSERFPGLLVCGHLCPPFRPLTEEEDSEAVALINAARPDIVWVGLSTPKQERWMAAHTGPVHAAVLVGVGAAFDMHAGLLPQAPVWVQRHGIEWLYRLCKEPRRLWRRYARNNPTFVLAVIRRRPYLRPGLPVAPAEEPRL